MTAITIPIRSVQQYLYCPHRWGLMEIEKAWAENYYVTKADLLHEHVHDPNHRYAAKGKKVFSSVSIYNDQPEYDLYGIVDCLELKSAADGVEIDGKTYEICIVEYKPTQPKDKPFHEEDLMQVFAQKLCVDHTFHTDCDAVLYYDNVRKRVPLPLKENFELYDQRLKQLLKEMRMYLEKGNIPPIRKDQKCSGCSMKDLCMPSVKNKKSFVRELNKIRKSKADEE